MTKCLKIRYEKCTDMLKKYCDFLFLLFKIYGHRGVHDLPFSNT